MISSLLINASTLSGTGVCQVAVSFITECKRFTNIHFSVFLSHSMASKIDVNEFGNNFEFYYFKYHPVYGIRGFLEKKRMITLEKEIHPDCVFSIFGPSCWKPIAPHLMGYAYGHYVYPDSPVYSLMRYKDKIYRNLLKIGHRYYLKHDGDYYVCETEDVSNRLSHFLNINRCSIFTVGNSINHYFKTFIPKNSTFLPSKKKNEFRFLSLCTPYIHKNLSILNKVIPLLIENNRNIDFKFIVTMDKRNFNNLFPSKNIRSQILNVGILNPEQCPQIYSECDALFSPTLLECFSANYPEAMFMKKPILTSNLSFATSVCSDAALYFDPLSPQDIVDKILALLEKNIYYDLVRKGLVRLQSFETSEERAAKYISLCSFISNH